MVENRHDDDFRVTFSAGISDLTMAARASELLQLADDALYWGKAHGRDCSRIYDARAVARRSDAERVQVLARSQAYLGLQALARSIDARDPATHRHSERVAELAGRLARELGWSEDRVALLRDAALIHDIGKLAEPGRADDGRAAATSEPLELGRHVELSASIAEDVLGYEQLEWIRQHHERPDGGGLPQGLRAGQISQGATLLGLANAYDMMTRGRTRDGELSGQQALAKCREGAGTRFDAAAVVALEQVLERACAPEEEPRGEGDRGEEGRLGAAGGAVPR
jgi:putative nucleotidyltransferase with HDIG domain